MLAGGGELCVSGAAEATDTCQDACDAVGVCQEMHVSLAPCEDNEDPTATGTGSSIGCSGWDPATAVTYQGSNLWDIDESFWNDLLSNTTPLWNCDSATVSDEGTYWEWSNITSGDLAKELGFHNGDQIVSIDGITIVTADDAFRVFALKVTNTSHTVRLKRGGSNLSFTYRIL